MADGARTGGTAVDHVGLTVTDLDAAIAWYGAVFGLWVEQGPTVIGGTEERVRDIFGPDVGDFRIAYLGSETGVRLQLFEFTEPPVERRSEELPSTGARASRTSVLPAPTWKRRSPDSRRTAVAGVGSTAHRPVRCTATARTPTETSSS